MKDCETVRVELSERSYDIIFTGLGSDAAVNAFAALPARQVLLVADSNTAQYLPVAVKSLEKSGKKVDTFIFPSGESSKNIGLVMQICARASELGMGRDGMFAALGGGVTGDATGFAAAVFMRGIPFIQLPTSLLAMVDSSVGGKTAVDTAAGKNLVGAFHQPRLVVIDCDLLATLPEKEFASGMAEIIKTALIKDAGFVKKLQEFSAEMTGSELRYAVKRSCEIKAAVVAADEKESGDSGRIFLNYGHTFGHALEHLSNYQLTHGEAVAIGMDMAAFAAVQLGLCSESLLETQHALLTKYRLAPENFAAKPLERDAKKIVNVMKGDKKNSSGSFRAVLPLVPGEVKTVALDIDRTADMIDSYYSFRFKGLSAGAARKNVVILGLGLLGSSLARSIDRKYYSVGVWDIDPAVRIQAQSSGAAEEIYDSPEAALAGADIAVLCLPVPVTEEFICRHASAMNKNGILTDVASVKGAVIAAADKFSALRFVGSHPMAGTEKSGFAAGFAGLFNNADVFIVPGRYSTRQDMDTIAEFWRHLSTYPREISAVDHDKLVANTSHMLHIIASALTQSILDCPDAAEQRRNYFGCATGFRDTSRIASSNPGMWRDICIANTPAILPALDAFEERLQQMRSALVAGDADSFERIFLLGRELRDSWLCYKNSHALPCHIVLCGIKHSGKTTVGRALAEVMAMKLTDTDEEITAVDPAHRSVREIFRNDGEEAFRRMEAAVLTRLAADNVRQIIALGGGALSNPFVPETVWQQLGFIVQTDVSDEVAFERISVEGLPPFLADKADPFGEFVRMNESRRQLFARFAAAKVDGTMPPHRNALHILSLYKDAMLGKC